MNQFIYQYVRTLTQNKCAFVDIDGTLTANPWDTTEKDLLDKNLTQQAISKLQEQEYLCILCTSRTAEMCMSEAQYLISKNKHGFARPQPHTKREGGHYSYMKPEDFFPPSILGLPIIISSSGAVISILQKDGGYATDTSFYPDGFPNPTEWRVQTASFLNSQLTPFSYGEIEVEESYTSGKAGIFPADYRIQLIFSSQQELQLMSENVRKKNGLCFTTDSNPDKNIYSAYVTPKNGKVDAINHVLTQLQQPTSEILIIGDSSPDLEAGLQVKAKNDAHITFFLVGGSRLFTHLPNGAQTLVSTPTKNRQIVLGDALFPGAVGPRSIVEFLSKKDYNNTHSGY